MSRVIYRGGRYKRSNQISQPELKKEFGYEFNPGAIVEYKGELYKFDIAYAYGAEPYFEKMSRFSIWFNKKRGRIK